MKRGDRKGFTIIEVSLVLAIAGLIFLMIFIALPALRRTQRDSARRDDMLTFIKKVKDYQTNNRGTLPRTNNTDGELITWEAAKNTSKDNTASWAGFYRDYMGESFMDPDGENYKLLIVKCGVSTIDTDCVAEEQVDLGSKAFPNDYKLIIVSQATCYGDRAKSVANPRKIAVLYRLEGAGAYCASS